MSFSFPAYHEEILPMAGNSLSLLEAARAGAAELGWRFSQGSQDCVTFKVPASFTSWGEKVSVLMGSGSITIRSECTLVTQCLDWGKNRKNVRRCIEAIGSRMTSDKLKQSVDSDGSKLDHLKQVYSEINRVLFEEWDPIGVNAHAPRDEYESYVGPLYQLLASGASDAAVVEYLSTTEIQAMGLFPRDPQDDLFEVVKALRKISF